MPYMVYILIFAAFFFLSQAFTPKKTIDTVSILKVEKKTLSPQQIILKLLKPLNILSLPLLKILPLIGRGLDKKLSFVRWDLTPADFISVKITLSAAIVVPLFILVPASVPFLPIVLVILFFIPDFILSGKMKARKEEIVRVLPETVDLLSLCVSAGLDFMASVRWITAKAQTNPMIEELK